MKTIGTIALDIDGTITEEKERIPPEVISYLSHLHKEGWQLAFVTGRPFSFAYLPLAPLPFPYLFIAQNGSLALEMPGKKEVLKRYLSPHHLPLLEEAYRGIESDFLLYAGYERGDICYFRPSKFPPEERLYLADLEKRQPKQCLAEWRAVEAFDPEEIGPFPLIKCFGPAKRLSLLQERLASPAALEQTRLRDPFAPGIELLLLTDRGVTKGSALKKVWEQRGRGRGERVIAAGDDLNDLTLFEVADVAIAMPHAPEALRRRAHLIAPPTRECGIIRALEEAIRWN